MSLNETILRVGAGSIRFWNISALLFFRCSTFLWSQVSYCFIKGRGSKMTGSSLPINQIPTIAPLLLPFKGNDLRLERTLSLLWEHFRFIITRCLLSLLPKRAGKRGPTVHMDVIMCVWHTCKMSFAQIWLAKEVGKQLSHYSLCCLATCKAWCLANKEMKPENISELEKKYLKI